MQNNSNKHNDTDKLTKEELTFLVKKLVKTNRELEEKILNNEKSVSVKIGSKWFNNVKSSEYLLANSLVFILDTERASNYHKWTQVGRCLKNTDLDLYSSFIEFSKKCPEKYDESFTSQLWEKYADKNITIDALKTWAYNDNFDKYIKIMADYVENDFCKVENANDLAKIAYKLLKHKYVCDSIRGNVWYEFNNHRWEYIKKKSDNLLTLSISDIIIEELILYLQTLYVKYNKCAEKDYNTKTKLKKVLDILDKIEKRKFRKQLFDECKEEFYDPKFIEKLDGNPNLIGFDNGVYDLKTHIFRDGIPEDMLSLSVGYDYKEYNMDHPYIAEIDQFFSKVMPDGKMREYILTLLSSYLDGHIKTERINIWAGNGDNGKSKTIELFQHALGDYSATIPISLLTRKKPPRGATPELANTRGKRFCVFQEPEDDDKIYVGRMKELIGGDKIIAKKLYRESYEFKPQFKLLLPCNILPRIPEEDKGTWRRVRVSPWENEFVEVDRYGLCHGKPLEENQFPRDIGLIEKLKKWKKVFLWYLIKKYYLIYTEDGLIEPKKVLDFTNRYKNDSDIFFDFLSSTVQKTNNVNDFEPISAVYQLFKSWYRESHSNNDCPSIEKLQNYIINHGYTFERGYVKKIKFIDHNQDDDLDL